MNKIKAVLAVVVGVPVLGLVAYIGIDDYMNGTGELHIKAPYRDGVTVLVDGDEVAELEAGEHTTLEIEQGEHDIEIITESGDEIEHEVKVESGFFEALLPAPEQCFADLDVYDTFYGKDDPVPEPEVDATYEDDDQIEVGSHHYYDEADLPFSVDEGTSVHLILEIPCDLVDADDDEVRAELAYTEDDLS